MSYCYRFLSVTKESGFGSAESVSLSRAHSETCIIIGPGEDLGEVTVVGLPPGCINFRLFPFALTLERRVRLVRRPNEFPDLIIRSAGSNNNNNSNESLSLLPSEQSYSTSE